MADKSPLEKVQDAVIEVVREVKDDPAAAAAKAVEQVRGVVALGLMVVGQVAQTAADRLMPAPAPHPSAPKPPVVERDQPTPADVARVVEMKPPAKKAPAKKAPPKKTAGATPSGKLPAKKAPAKKAPPHETPGAGTES